ncbi:MAG: hypothetical protein MK135_06230 [Polyangiaceae bacterium]|nr:hypothetical protein [Polyangiaceae bacterium]
MDLQLSLQLGALRAVILPETAGRVLSLRWGDYEFLASAEVHPENWGATFWPSPQSTWGWPPIRALDALPWKTLLREPQKVLLESPQVEIGQELAVASKEFSVFRLGRWDVFRASYAMERATDFAPPAGDTRPELACWEISRVESEAISFYLKGSHQITKVEPHGALVPQELGDWSVLDHRDWQNGESQKIHADSSGNILGNLDRQTRQVVLKFFQPVRLEEQADGEGVVEIFWNGCGKYIELEVQGAATLGRKGRLAELVVDTICVPLPPELEPEATPLFFEWIETLRKEWQESGSEVDESS